MADAARDSKRDTMGAKLARHSGVVSHVVLSLLLAGLGGFALQWREWMWRGADGERIAWEEWGMDALQRFSFDVPFLVRSSLPSWLRGASGERLGRNEVVLVYLDEQSADELKQPMTAPWDRGLHARLVERLAAAGARAIVFDVVFDQPSPSDAGFAAAMARAGNVFLGATIRSNASRPLTADEEERFLQVGLVTERLVRSTSTLNAAARGWGLLTFRPVDADYGVRRLFVGKRREGLTPWPAITWEAAKTLGAELPAEDANRFARRWMNYYGPTDSLPQVSFARVLAENAGVEMGAFKDKVVFVGGRSQLGSGPQKLLDEFSTPWSRFRGRSFMPGTEIHATIFLNLVHRDWLARWPAATEMSVVVLLGLALGALRWLRPWRVVSVAAIAALMIFASACVMQWQARCWWNWAVPVLVQVPVGAVLAIGSRYYLEERRKRKLRRAFGFYLSPELATEIAERDFPLAPGGGKVVATQIFTDLEGFTALSEKLGDSARLGQVLVEYFTRTTDVILAERGTVIKFVGDAVHAAWGAPLPQPDHAERAVRAAWRLSQVAKLEVPVVRPDGTTEIVPVRTRVGVHTGEALAGNLGSARRFDYAIIGDATNFASRLEGTNKFTGTSILVSDDTVQRLGGKFLLRRLGSFRMKGKTKSVVIHELLGEDAAARPEWLERFDAGLAAWTRGEGALARECFEDVRRARGGSDGPAEFYLARISATLTNGRLPEGWNGDVALEEK